MANEIINRTVNIFISSGDAQRVYDQLIAKQKKLNDQLAQNPKNAAKIREELAKLEEPISRAAKKLSGELEPSLKDTQSTATKLRNELGRMSESDPGFKEKVALYAQANKELETQRGKVGLLSQAWKSFWQEAKTVAVGVIVGNTLQTALQTVLSYVGGIVTGSAKIADELSDIEKTTGLTKDQVLEVNKELSKIDTRTSASGLRQLAEEAGKLGKDSVEDIVKFVKEADQIKVALGEDLGEDAIISIGKLAKIFKTEMLNIGSAINEIGANSEASERFAVDFLNRLAGTGPAVKISASDLLGYGAALEIAGQTAEVSGTALSNFFIDFVRDSEKFGKAAGFAQGELTKLINEKGTNAGFIEFLTRLKQANPDADQFLRRMQELGIDGSRGANVMLALSNNIGEVRKQQVIANDAMAAGTSLTEEFTKKNNNAAAELDKLKKNFASLFASSTVREGGEAVIHMLNNLVNIIRSSMQFVKEHGGLIATLGIIYAATTIKLKSFSIATVFNNAVMVIQRTVTAATVAAQLIWAEVMDLLRGRIALLTAVQRIWNAVTALGAGPIGILLVAIGGLVIGIEALLGNTKKLTAEQRIQAEVSKRVAEETQDTHNKMTILTGVLKDNKVSLENRKKALQELINISPEYLSGLTLENINTAEGKKILDGYNAALLKNAQLKAKSALLDEESKDRAKNTLDLLKAVKTAHLEETGFAGITKEIESGSPGAAVQKFLDTRGTGPFAKKLQEFLNQSQDINVLTKDLTAAAKENVESVTGGIAAGGGGTSQAAGKLEKLRQTLKDLQEQREKAPDDKSIAGLNTKIKETEEAIAKLEGRNTKLSSSEKKTANDTKALTEELKQLAISLLPEGTDVEKFEKSLTQLDDKYDKLRQKAGNNNALLLQIEKLYQTERQKIIDDFAQKENKKVQDQIAKNKQLEEQRRKQFFDGIQPFLDRGLQRNIDQLASIDRDQAAKHELDFIKAHGKKKLDAELQLLNDQEKKELEKKDLTENEKLLIEEKFRIKRQEAENNYWAGYLGQFAKYAQQALDIGTLLGQINTNRENAELDRDRARNDKKKANLDKRLKAGLISQQQYDREVEKLNKQQESREKAARLKQFKRDQRASMVQAGIDGLKAVSKTLAEFGPPVPPNFLGIAAMAYTLLSTALQVKLIASKEPPAFAKGGKLNGRSHNQGGMAVVDHYGRKQAEVEGDEGILNKFTMRDSNKYTVSGTPSQIASALNARHGGVHWDTGATLVPAWKIHKPQPMNFGLIRQAQHYAAGGTFQKAPAAAPVASDENQMMMTVMAGLMASVDNLNTQLAAGIVAKTFITDQEAQQDRLNKIRDDGTFKP